MFENAEQVIGLGAAVLILPVLMAHLKPLLRWLPGAESSDPPWPFVVDILGVLWVSGLWYAGAAPEWINNPLVAVLTGIALGIAAGATRDVYTSTSVFTGVQVGERRGRRGRGSDEPPPSSTVYREPGT